MTPDIDSIIAFEQGDLDDDETITLFQSLVNSGLAWTLQGSYGRTAMHLITAGLVTVPTQEVQ
jgi:hypothetical protein